MHPVTLSFPDEREKHFREAYLRENLKLMRAAGIVATGLWLLYGLTDLLWAAPALLAKLWAVRYGVVFPAQALLLAAAFVPRFYRWVPALLVLALMAVAGGLAMIDAVLYQRAEIPSHLGYVILTLAAYTFFRLRFLQGLLLGLFIIVLSALHGWLMGSSLNLLVYDASILAVVNAFGAFAAYSLEYYARENYLLVERHERDKALEAEARALETARQVARTVAHEFNNPLAVIQGIWDLHVRPTIPEQPETRRRMLQRVPDMVDRMSGLVVRLRRITGVRTTDYVEGVSIMDLTASSLEEKAQEGENGPGEGEQEDPQGA
jgi:signal transduction histidine kinase